MFNSNHNSWFRLVKKSDKDNQESRLDFDKFKDVLTEQILRKINAVNKTYLCFDDNYFLENLNIILERHVYDQIPINDGKYFCVLTFHATSSTTKINSICKHGYIIPGMKHPTKGWQMYMRTGNLYGDGVYSSTDFVTAEWYSFLDSNQSVQLIINILVPKNIKKVTERYYSDNLGNVTNNSIPEHYDNFYKDELGEYDTLMTLDEKIFISGNTECIIPVAILTMKPNKQINKLCHVNILYNSDDSNIKFNNEISYLNFSNDNLPIINFFGNYNIIDFSRHFEKKNKLQTKHLLLIPNFFAYSNSCVNLRESINNFINSLPNTDKKNVYYYGLSCVNKNINNPNDFINFTNTVKVSKRMYEEHIITGLLKVFDSINATEDPYINIIYIFVNDPIDINTKNLQDLYVNKIFDTLIIKLIFFKNLNKMLCDVKNAYQNTFPFELYYHLSTLTTFGDTADILLDENENISDMTGQLFSSYVDSPNKTIGEGFIESLNNQPTFDINMQGLTGLYKGYTPVIKISFSTSFPKKSLETSLLVKSKPVVYDETLYESNNKKLNKKETFYSYLFREYVKTTELINNLQIEKNRLAECLNVCKDDYLQKNVKIDQLNIKRQLNEQTDYRHYDYKNSDIYKDYTNCCKELEKQKIYFSKLEYYASDYDDIKKLYSVLIPLISRFRNYIFVHPERCKLHQKLISDLFEKFLEVINDYPIEPNQLNQSNQLNQTNEPNKPDKQSEIIKSSILARCYFENIYPTFGLRKEIRMILQKLMSDIMSFSKVKLTGKCIGRLANMKFSKNIIKRSKNASIEHNLEELKMLCEIPKKIKVKSIDDILRFVKIKGLLIRNKQSSSSEIEPWNIIIEHVSNSNESNIMTFKDFFSLTECGHPIRDSDNVLVNNILIENVKTNDTILKLVYGYLFTRVPNLYITTQPIALITNTWVSLLEKVYKIIFLKKQYDHTQLFNNFMYSIKLFELIKSHVSENNWSNNLKENNWFKKLREKILDFNNIEKNISTKNEIVSLTQILACLTSINFSELSKKNFNKLCVMLLVECTIRSCKISCKMEKSTSDKLIANVLGIDMSVDPQNWTFDKDKLSRSINITNKFFMKQYTNCSFFTIVAVIGFMKYYQLNLTPDEIFDKFKSGEISSRNFLLDHFETNKGKITQLGLYLFGMKYSNYDEITNEEDTYPFNFDTIIKKEIKKQLSIIEIKQTASKNKNIKHNLNLMKRIEKGSAYQFYHSSYPTMFTQLEVEELNKIRNPDDQFILKDGGLLEYHCCYPNCPFYLKNLTLLSDCHNKKNALKKHLQYDELFDNYVKGFHRNGIRLVKWSKTYEEFYTKMQNMYGKITFTDQMTETLKEIWKKFK